MAGRYASTVNRYFTFAVIETDVLQMPRLHGHKNRCAQHFLMQKDLVDFLLIDLRPRPGMYLTAYKLSYLSIYLTGVDITCWQLNKNGEYLERFSGEKGFLQWSWKKYDLGHPSFKLHHYLEIANGDEKQALDLFFEDLEAYHLESSR